MAEQEQFNQPIMAAGRGAAADAPRVKICGLMVPRDCALMNEVRPDYVGFVFAHTRHFLTDAQAAGLRAALDPGIPAVGVFVDEEIPHIVALVEAGTIQLVQLHGSEDAAYIADLRAALADRTDAGIPFIRAARVRTGEEPLAAQAMDCEYLLLDAYDPTLPGGSGRRLRLDLIPPLSKPCFVAGGLSADNVAEVIAAVHPWGVDVSSSLETTDPDGVLHKDRDRVLRFMNAVK